MKRKVLILIREDSRKDALEFSNVLFDDFGIHSVIKKVSDLWSGGIKKINEFLKNETRGYDKSVIVCFDLGRWDCDEDCCLKGSVDIPVASVRIESGIKNALGAAVIKTLSVLSRERRIE